MFEKVQKGYNVMMLKKVKTEKRKKVRGPLVYTIA